MMNRKIRLWIKVMKIFKAISGCHQIPERSFFLHGYQFPLCSRCTGILAGYLCSLLFLVVFNYFLSVPVCVIFLFPLILDGVIQLIFNIISNNARRFVTGLLFGVGLMQLIIKMCTYCFIS